MAEERRTVQVTGLPTGVSKERLADKLAIHFLRTRNGGGEITSITIPDDSSTTALITFEDSEGECRIFLQVAMTVDYGRLPDGRAAMRTLKKNFADVQFSFDQREELCTVKGRFSDIQDLANEVLSLLQTSEPAKSPVLKTSEKSPGPTGQEDHSQKAERKKENKMKERAPFPVPRSPSPLCPESTGAGHLDSTRHATEASEDFSLMMDSDIYKYIQKHGEEKYKQILCKHKVEVVDISTKDVTTLFLQSSLESLGSMESLQEAHWDLRSLYQEYENTLRKEQILKEGITESKLYCEILQFRYPKILLSEDDTYIYIIGSSSDVSEAKQYLLNIQIKQGSIGKYDSGSPSTLLPTRTSLDDKNDKHPKLTGSGKPDGSKDYRLAANFNSCREPVWKSKVLGDDDLFSRLGPSEGAHMFSRDFASQGSQAFSSGGFYLRDLKGPDRTSEDVLFKKYESSSAGSRIKDRRPFQSGTTVRATGPVKAVQGAAASSTFHHMDLFAGGEVLNDRALTTTSHNFEFKPLVQRSNSFSGRITSKEDRKPAGLNNIPTSQNRNSSSSPGKEDSATAQLFVSEVVWVYVKDAYSDRIASMTSGIQIKESKEKGSIKLLLVGLDQLKLSLCKQELQRLCSVVEMDLTSTEVSLSQLGVTHPKDETLEMFCKELKNKYEKIKIVTSDCSVRVWGPKELCVLVTYTLKEVFNAGSLKPQRSVSEAYPSAASLSSVVDTHEDEVQSSQTKETWVEEQHQDHYNSTLKGNPRDPSTRQQCQGSPSDPGTESPGAKLPLQSSTKTQDAQARVVPIETCIQCQNSSVSRTKCGILLCIDCQLKIHTSCRVCAQPSAVGIKGSMTYTELSTSLSGHPRDMTLKITYIIPDGIQGEGHPNPGSPFSGGAFDAYLPLNPKGKKLLSLLKKAFEQGLTFTIRAGKTEDRVTWGRIPHKTKMEGGKSGNGYPDATYLSNVLDMLKSFGIESIWRPRNNAFTFTADAGEREEGAAQVGRLLPEPLCDLCMRSSNARLCFMAPEGAERSCLMRSGRGLPRAFPFLLLPVAMPTASTAPPARRETPWPESAFYFRQNYVPTVFENYTASFEIEKQRIELNMWDTSGGALHSAGPDQILRLTPSEPDGSRPLSARLENVKYKDRVRGRVKAPVSALSLPRRGFGPLQLHFLLCNFLLLLTCEVLSDSAVRCARKKNERETALVTPRTGTMRIMSVILSQLATSTLPKGGPEESPSHSRGSRPGGPTEWREPVDSTEQGQGSSYYDNVRPLAYPDSDAVLICFDISRPETLDSVLKKWQGETQEFCPNAKVVLVGCKLDMRTDLNTLRELSKQRLIPVTHEQGSTLARQIGAVAYVECTSKVSENSVRDVFHITTLASVNRIHKNLKRSNSKRGLKRVSQLPGRTELLENPEMRKDRAKSCSIM
ncbi:RND2 protein, partial [Atractosteus spatula]|nr:RND2 protein [Atractosteus spatula]